ncbi:MAG: SHD1 domain-containing protein [Kiritimatiellia bacterium]|jgi:uncharacterized protein YkwD|nr:SHD1 domain-containing protein [Kiritimatiellia bacterium]MDP6848993.1 SHD1 domain-containing protein [Kiritimatiellia bacterium]
MKTHRRIAVLLLLVLLGSGSFAVEAGEESIRTWTSRKGTEIEARFLRQTGNMIVLETKEGKKTNISLSFLGQADRDYVAELTRENRKAKIKKYEERVANMRRGNRNSNKKNGPPAPVRADYLSKLEREVIDEMNLARTDPRGYARHIEKLRDYHVGDGVFEFNSGRFASKEGLAAVEEAIEFLKEAESVGQLSPSKGLSLAAKSHVDDIGPAGVLTHTGTDGSTMKARIEKQGSWQNTIGENMAFGLNSGRDIVVQLIVDDGVPDRGHRGNIFKAKYRVAGVSIGNHKIFNTCCVIDYAGGFSD